jgi:site-specific recombinase XerD
VRNVKGSREPAGRRISGGELGAILAGLALDRSAGARDAAMIALAYAGGLRRSELAALRLDNLQDKGKEGFELRLVGKGDKERVLFVNGGVAEALRDYLAARGREAGPLFYASRKAGTLLVGRCMSPRPSTTCCATGPSGPVWSSRPTTCGGAS